MTTETLTLTAFLLERIAEQEARCEGLLKSDALPHSLSVRRTLGVALATCKAHRAIVEGHRKAWQPSTPPDYMDGVWASEDHTLRALASVYADHPAWREEWTL